MDTIANATAVESPAPAVEDTLHERVVRAIHEGLGGDGWAYANYGGKELVSMRDELDAAARAVIAILAPSAASDAEAASP